MRISRWALGPVLALALVAAPSVGADASPKKDPDPGLHATPIAKAKVKLNAAKHGKAALTALAGQLDTAARINGKSVKQLHDLLANDPTAWIAPDGHLFFADRFEAPTTTARTSTSATSVPPAPEPLASTFTLHSKPGSQHTVYLDFNGYTLGAGSWDFVGFTQGTYHGFSLDSDYSTFSDAERAYVQHAWQVVSEKYAPFDIDVTTQNPGANAYNRDGAGDPTYGDHVVFTDVATGSGAKPSSICPVGCDGISFNSSFNETTDNVDRHEPVWVYTRNYHWYSGIAGEIAAHEVGHTLGLSHDGLGTGDGDFGSGNDAYYQGGDLWSPVMGSGVGALSQFSKGEYANASNTEDDLAVIAAHGAPVRSDDWGDADSPSAIGQHDFTYAEDGVLEDAADQDVFTINRTCTTPLTVRATGIHAGQTADLQVRVLSGDGLTVLGTGAATTQPNLSTYPRTPQGADAEVTLASPPSGDLRIEVDGVGQGDPLTTDGYSDYGSIGRYHLTATGCSGVVGAAPGPVTNLAALSTAKTTTATLQWSAPSSTGDGGITGYRVSGAPSGTFDVPASDTSVTLTGLEPGTDYDLSVYALNAYGAGDAAQTTVHIATWTPGAAPKLKATAYNTTMILNWTEPSNPGRALGSSWTVQVWAGGDKLDQFDSTYGYTGVKFTGVGGGHYKLVAWLNYDSDIGTRSGIGSTTVDVGPTAARIGTPSSGTSGGTATVTVRWAAPVYLRGAKITSYTLGAYKLNSSNQIVRVYVSSPRSATSRSYVWALPAGRYKFRVQAHATTGWTPISGYSTIATSR